MDSCQGISKGRGSGYHTAHYTGKELPVYMYRTTGKEFPIDTDEGVYARVRYSPQTCAHYGQGIPH